MTDEAMLAEIREKQAKRRALCQRLLGLSDAEASAIVEPLGYYVQSVRIDSDVALTLDMRTDRIRLLVDDGGVVQRAMVG